LVAMLALMLLDLSILIGCIVLVVTIRYLVGGSFSPSLYLSMAWTPVVYVLIAILTKVYTHLQTPPERLKRISGAVSFFFLVAVLFAFLTHQADVYSRSIFLMSWGISLVAIPIARMLASRMMPNIFSWRAPCVLIGSNNDVGRVANQINQEGSGLSVAAVSLAPGETTDFEIMQIPLEDLPALAAVNPHCYAVLSADSSGSWPPPDTMGRLSFHFRHVLLRSPQIDQLSTWTRGVRLGGLTLLTCEFKLLDPWRRRFKRIFDIVFCMTAGLVILPFLGLLYVLIRLDSPGPAFFIQERLGEAGKPFRIIKFRTMHCDAEDDLKKLLFEDEDLACQWRENQKLMSDPRITRVGWWLRKTSIDELPQIVNVLFGTMSLVGPRPIVEAEIAKYGDDYATFTHVKPGITGLWQVSGRNKTDYAQRVALDVAYVKNWSIYIDLWILARTTLEVFKLTGC